MVLRKDSHPMGPSLCWTSFGLPLNFHLLWRRARLGAWINPTHADLLVSNFSSKKEMCERCISHNIIFVHSLRGVENKPYLRYDRTDSGKSILRPIEKSLFLCGRAALSISCHNNNILQSCLKSQIDDDKSLHSIKTFSKFITGWRGVAEWKFRRFCFSLIFSQLNCLSEKFALHSAH